MMSPDFRRQADESSCRHTIMNGYDRYDLSDGVYITVNKLSNSINIHADTPSDFLKLLQCSGTQTSNVDISFGDLVDISRADLITLNGEVLCRDVNITSNYFTLNNIPLINGIVGIDVANITSELNSIEFSGTLGIRLNGRTITFNFNNSNITNCSDYSYAIDEATTSSDAATTFTIITTWLDNLTPNKTVNATIGATTTMGTIGAVGGLPAIVATIAVILIAGILFGVVLGLCCCYHGICGKKASEFVGTKVPVFKHCKKKRQRSLNKKAAASAHRVAPTTSELEAAIDEEFQGKVITTANEITVELEKQQTVKNLIFKFSKNNH